MKKPFLPHETTSTLATGLEETTKTPLGRLDSFPSTLNRIKCATDASLLQRCLPASARSGSASFTVTSRNFYEILNSPKI